MEAAFRDTVVAELHLRLEKIESFNDFVLKFTIVFNQPPVRDARQDAKCLYVGIAMLVACLRLIDVCSSVQIKQSSMTSL